MFAIAVWDRSEQALYLCRDRTGEKPIYYGYAGNAFLFGSELKALHRHPKFQAEIDQAALVGYLRFGYVPTPRSIFKGISKLPPATFIKITKSSRELVPQSYWSMKEVVQRAADQPFRGSLSDAAEELTTRLTKTVKSRMQSDVPLGAFLSGGIDSSTVVSLMQNVSATPVHTFSIGFQEDSHNEAINAERVARHLRTEHVEFYVTAAQAREVIPRLPELFDEPFSDSSQIPTFLISQLAKRHVTVALTGDGGDEVFGGYNRYRWHGRVWNMVTRSPRFMSAGLGGALTILSPAAWDKIFKLGTPFLPASIGQKLAGQKLHKLANIVTSRSKRDLYRQISSVTPYPSELFTAEFRDIVADAMPNSFDGPDFVEEMMYLDTITYLTDDILTKVDRASMGASLETRAPFLDHEIIEFAWTLPLSMKIKDGTGKLVLRKVLEKFVPSALTERPKAGFAIPVGAWLRSELRDWAEGILDPARLRAQGYLDVEAVRKKWNEHLSGRRDWEAQLWNILSLQAWLEHTTSARACHSAV
jgi:asparagine synthase (glutamine-hydrolysing)